MAAPAAAAVATAAATAEMTAVATAAAVAAETTVAEAEEEALSVVAGEGRGRRSDMVNEQRAARAVGDEIVGGCLETDSLAFNVGMLVAVDDVEIRSIESYAE